MLSDLPSLSPLSAGGAVAGGQSAHSYTELIVNLLTVLSQRVCGCPVVIYCGLREVGNKGIDQTCAHQTTLLINSTPLLIHLHKFITRKAKHFHLCLSIA